jgi:hypothetical protein
VLQAVLAALIGIPGYESISEDLKLLAKHNRKLSRSNRLLQAAKRRDIGQTHTAASLRELNEVYQRSRLISISDRVIQGLLREQFRDMHLADPEQRRIGSALFAEFDRFQSTSRDAGRISEVEIILRDFDVYYRLLTRSALPGWWSRTWWPRSNSSPRGSSAGESCSINL